MPRGLRAAWLVVALDTVVAGVAGPAGLVLIELAFAIQRCSFGTGC